jgi:hypothetical protein
MAGAPARARNAPALNWTSAPEHLATPEALASFLHSFETGTLPKTEWTHAAHVAAAAYYLHGSAFAVVHPFMRARISAFNEAVGCINGPASGYHKTLTHFWLLIVAEHLRQNPSSSRLAAAQQAVAAFGQARTLHTLYYSGDVVKDSATRHAWRESDLLPIPNPEP